MFHVSIYLLSKTRTSSWYDVVTTLYDDVVRRRDDVHIRYIRIRIRIRSYIRRTYITGFSVTFLCKYLTDFITRCCYTVNELIYDVSRIYMLT